MKKILIAFLLVLCLILPTTVPVSAKNNLVTDISCTLTTSSAVVSGHTDAEAVMVRIKDASNNVITLQSFAVDSNGNFSASLENVSLTAGATYTVSVADYEGGSWATETVTVGSSSSGGSTSGGSTSGGSSSGGATSGGSSESGSSDDEETASDATSESPANSEDNSGAAPENNIQPQFEEIEKNEEEETVTAAFTVGKIKEEPSNIAVALDPKDEDDAALIDALFTEEEKAAFAGEPIEIILSVSTTKPSKSEEKAADECATALEDILSGKAATAKELDIPEELQTLFSGAAAASRNDTRSGDGSAAQDFSEPEITIAAAYDFSVLLKVGDKPPVEIHDLGNVRTVVNFLIDKKLKNNDPLIRRIFLMIHLTEDGRREVLSVDVDKKTMNAGFAFRSCSTFILAYVDVANFTMTGEKLTSKKYNANYRVVDGGDVNGKVGTLEYVAPVKKKTSHTVFSKVTVDNITYKVTGIAANAFKGNKTVNDVTIGKYVTSIGDSAFYGCTGLKTVTIGKKVSTISARAFYKTKALENVIIESKKLKSTTIGKSVWTKAGTAGKGITFTVPSSKLKSYRKLFNKVGTVKAE